MVKKLHACISLVSGLSLIFNSILPAAVVPLLFAQPAYAQEATESAQTPTPTLEPTIEPLAEPDPAPQETITITPTEEATPSPTITEEPTPTPGQILDGVSTEAPTPTPEITGSQPQTDSESVSTTPTPTPEPKPQGSLTTEILKNTSAQTLNLDSQNIVGSATLTTNKPDYAPTDAAVIAGSGFIPEHQYKLFVSSTDPPATSSETEIKTDANGSFTSIYQLDGNYRPNYSVEVKDGDTVVATTTFTDSATVNSATLNGSSSVSVGPGDNITAALNATSGSANADKWKGTGWRIGTAPGAETCFDNNDHTSSTNTETFSITASTSVGTYNAYFQTYSNNTCTTDASATTTLTSGVVVQARDLTAVKSNSLGGGNAVANTPFTWTIRVANSGPATATFANNDEILKDEMPNTSVNDYGTASISNSGITGTITCAQSGGHKENLSCTANGTVTFPAGSYTDISVTVNPTAAGTLVNPRSGQTCATDAGSKVTESNESNNTCTDSVTVTADTTPPTAAGTPTTTSPTSNNKPTWTWTAAGDNVGVDHYIFYWDTVAGGEAHNSGSLSASTFSYTHTSALSQGTWHAKVRAFDAAGNSIDSGNGTVLIDTAAPTTTDNTDTSWHTSNVTITLTCNDGTGSGCDVIYFTTDGTTPTTSHYTGTGSSVFLTTDGTYTIKYFSVDLAGNQESVKTASHVVNLDKTKPTDPTDVHSTDHTINVSSNNATIAMAWTAGGSVPGATDALSGVDGYSYNFTQGATDEPDTTKDAEQNATGTTSQTLTEGSWYFHLRTVDNAGNWTDTVHIGPFPIALPDLIATKTNNVDGAADVGEPFTWTIRIQNNGTADAVFANNKVILEDNFPNSSVNDYDAPVISDSSGITGSVDCSQSGGHKENLTCKANGVVTIAAGGYLDIDVLVSTTAATTFTNPRSGQTCQVNPNGDVTENDTTNNTCADSVVVTGTPTAGNRADFAATKTNNTEDAVTFGNTFTWKIRVQNVGTKKGRFAKDQVILHDDLPASATYGTPSVTTSGTGGHGSISCAIVANVLTCSATGTKAKDKVEFPYLSYVDVSFDVTPTAWGTITNPISSGICLADPNDVVAENGETNNSCSNSVSVQDVISPETPVATPIAGNYTSSQSVTLSSSDTGGSGLAGIYYTTDGTTPDSTKTLYTGAITVDHDMTIKAIAYDNAGNTSNVLVATYGISSPPGGTSGGGSGTGDGLSDGRSDGRSDGGSSSPQTSNVLGASTLAFDYGQDVLGDQTQTEATASATLTPTPTTQQGEILGGQTSHISWWLWLLILLAILFGLYYWWSQKK